MKVLVTGATGFLGRHLVRALLAEGYEVCALGRNERGCEEIASEGAAVVRADLRDREAVTAACAGCDVVIHAGALSAPWGRRAEFRAVNIDGTGHVIAGCREHRVGRLVYVSSPSVVFDGRDRRDIMESAPYPRRFLCDYSWSKKIGEDLVNAAGQAGLEVVILRPKAMFGPGDTSLLPRIVESARRGRLPQIGGGENRVDLTYVDNVVQAVMLALAAEAVRGKTYHITNGESPPLWPLIRRVCRRLGVADRFRPLPYRLAYWLGAALEVQGTLFAREPPLTRYTVAILGRTQTYDISAARRDLGYEPRVSLDEGIERTLAYFEEAARV